MSAFPFNSSFTGTMTVLFLRCISQVSNAIVLPQYTDCMDKQICTHSLTHLLACLSCLTDGVDLKTSFPISRFVKGSQSFKVDLAVQGAGSDAPADFWINGVLQCSWDGIKLKTSNGSFCVDLVRDEHANLRVFHGVFSTKTDVSHESFRFDGQTSSLVVFIDYSQSEMSKHIANYMTARLCTRESPETAECNGAAAIHAITALVVSVLMKAFRSTLDDQMEEHQLHCLFLLHIWCNANAHN
ncbi:hypothetical protein TcWFU_006410 [Taenia crassiceps]|uniref:DUF5727 domain-containing protein n=1 Tax=Taenia crassiceps TaxID=6207 RepID=A0ABR4Q6D2_9CEST